MSDERDRLHAKVDPSEGPSRAMRRREVLALPLFASVAATAGALGACAAPRKLPCAPQGHDGAEGEGAHAHCAMRHCRYFRA